MIQDAVNVKMVCDAVVKFAAAVKQARADGWDASKDVPALMLEAMQDGMKIAENFKDAEAEMKSNPMGSIKAGINMVAEIVEMFK